jgi:hypothetical protein
VNTVDPAVIRTPLTQGAITKNPDGFQYHPHGERIPLGVSASPKR